MIGSTTRMVSLCFLMVVSLVVLGMEHQKMGNPSDYIVDIENQDMADNNGIFPDDMMLEFVPRRYEAAGKPFDDLKTGKSCVWKPKSPSDPHNHEGRWVCRDCGTTGKDCRILTPFGGCPGMELVNWDAQDGTHPGDGIQQRSHFRSDAMSRPNSWVMQTIDTPSWYESAVCSPDLTLPCFDIDRCAREDGPMKIFIYNPESTPSLLEKIKEAEAKFPNDIQYTTNHDDACLIVVGANSFEEKKDMLLDPRFMAGQNHFLLSANTLFQSHGDRVKPHSYNMEFAATMTGSLYASQIREGYDITTTMPQPWKRPPETDRLPLHRPRRLLLSFKGRVERWKLPFQHHRWLASQYWRNEPDVKVDAACGGEGKYELEGQEAYGELLLNATFVFAPGGGGVGSFRTTEALAADAIPVMVSHSPLPFAPEIDWSGCVVHISEARIIDAPRILRNMPEEEIRSRRERCRELYRGIYGSELLVALKLWRQRTLAAHKKRDVLRGMEDVIKQMAATKSAAVEKREQ